MEQTPFDLAFRCLIDMNRQIIFPLRFDGTDYSHTAAHQAQELFAPMREACAYAKENDPNVQLGEFVRMENNILESANRAPAHTKALISHMLTTLRSALNGGGYAIPEAVLKLEFDAKDEGALALSQDLARPPRTPDRIP